MDMRCGWEGEIHVGIVSEHEHERLGKEGNGRNIELVTEVAYENKTEPNDF